MSCFVRALALASATTIAMAASPGSARAQEPAPVEQPAQVQETVPAPQSAPVQEPPIAERLNVISANPFGLLLDVFNAEYARAITESLTVGVGGSFGSGEDEDDLGMVQETSYFNGDVFARFYPSGRPFEGWNFGGKIGVTSQEGWTESSTNLGYGFDVNRSWLLGVNNNFYVGVGFGLKRLLGDLPEGGIRIIPTFRVLNVGFAF